MRRPWRAAALLGPVLGMLGSSSLAFAQEELRFSDIEATVESPWPEVVGKGYAPVFVTMTNVGERRREITMAANTMSSSSATKLRATRRVSLEPHEAREIELFLPTFLSDGSTSNHYSFSMSSGGIGDTAVLSSGRGSWNEHSHSLVVVSRDRGLLEAQIQRDLETTALPHRPAGNSYAFSGFEASVALVPPDRLPRRPQAYSSLNVVAIDAAAGLPPTEQLESIASWVRLGGSAVFLSPEPGELDRVPSFEGAFEERFRVEVVRGVRAYTHGLGRLYVEPARTLPSPAAVELVKLALIESNDGGGNAPGWVPTRSQWRLKGTEIEIPGLGSLPLRTFMLLLFLFAVVIGPVNLVFLKRVGRPALLLLTIPVISVLASAGILLYGVFYQGLDAKAARHTLTHLDQRTARAATVERRMMFVGLSQGRGLRPDAGTTVLPEQVRSSGELYAAEFDDGVLLRGSYLPVRDPVRQIVLAEGPHRVHLACERRADGTIGITNNLSVPVRAVLLSDAEGRVYRHSGNVAAGSTADLQPAPAELAAAAGMELSGLQMYGGIKLAPSTYIARVAQTPFGDDTGLDLSVETAMHIVFGVLPAAEEDWQ